MRYPESCKIKYQNIEFKARRTQTLETKEQDDREIRKESNTTNSENLQDYN